MKRVTKSIFILFVTLVYIGCSSSSGESIELVGSSTPSKDTVDQITTTATDKDVEEKKSISEDSTIELGVSSKPNNTASTTTNNSDKQIVSKGYYKPTLKDTWQWQLKKKVKNIDYDATIYDIDLFSSSDELIASLHKRGKKVMCSFSVGSYESWRDDRDDFKSKEVGHIMAGWKDEKWLDIRSQNVRDIMKKRINFAAKKGCDGLELDNMDGYTPENDTGFNLTAEDQLDYNKFLANYAHKKGLFVALKNDMKQIAVLVDYFDLSINEECFQYQECRFLRPFITNNKPVFNAEYIYNSKSERRKLCNQSEALGFYTLVLPLALDDTFRFSCKDK